MDITSSARRLHPVATVLIVIAGMTHLAIAPMHWEHAPAHGLFFLIAGIAESGWGILALLRPSVKIYVVGWVMASGLVILWMIARVLPAPFGHGPEPLDALAVICKLSEVLGAVVLGLLIFRAAASTRGRLVAWRLITVAVVAAFAVAWGTYGVARAAEPILPWLNAPIEHQQEQELSPGLEHQPEQATPPAPEHHHP